MKKAAVTLALMLSAFTIFGGVIGGTSAASAKDNVKLSVATADCNASGLTKAQQLYCLDK